MVIFNCPSCRADIFFENNNCVNCGSMLGFDPCTLQFRVMTNGVHSALLEDGSQLPYCQNSDLNICNWLVSRVGDTSCTACALNRKVPNSNDPENFQKWQKMELAKHRLIYQLLKLGLPLTPKIVDPNGGLAFDFLSENNEEGVMTGHDHGVITVLLSEADSVQREQLRKQMSEPYRTLLGHFRHEIGHYYWPLLAVNDDLDVFRALFGNEGMDYGLALKAYYQNGAPPNWNLNHISKYASAHPWEDWAETWAHYLHLIDTLETAHSIGIVFQPENHVAPLTHGTCPDPYLTDDFKVIFDASVTLTCAANSLNRSMGIPDIYPFVIPEPVYHKLEFIHRTLAKYRSNTPSNQGFYQV